MDIPRKGGGFVLRVLVVLDVIGGLAVSFGCPKRYCFWVSAVPGFV